MPMTVKNDLTGKRFSRLTVKEFVPTESRHSRFQVVCDCGTEKTVLGQALINGTTVSCGCFNKELLSKMGTTHGMSGSSNKKRERVYRIWAGMMDRCEWAGHPSFERYGAKGIRVCQKWHNFEGFFADMGRPPTDKHSIDRIDTTKGYSPDNCRWADRRQQSINKTCSVWFRLGVDVLHISELCNRFNLSHKAIRARAVRRGNDCEAALRSVGIHAKRLAPGEWA